MQFYSTGGKVRGVSYREAVLEGLAADGGLYLPESYPQVPREMLKRWQGLSFLEVAIELAQIFFKGIFTAEEAAALCEEAFNFPLPCIAFPERIYALELFHGPSLSFKDVGARFLGALLRKWGEKKIALVATSGDTGSAVGLALHGIPRIKVFILYAKGKVTPSQEQQITTIGGNVTALQVDGTFDDCQEMLRKAVLDPELNGKVTTGNSQNIARIIAQAFYYFYAYAQLPLETEEAIFSVPCGNFGHLVSGMIAKKMGLPINRFLGATNINNEVPLFLRSGVFLPHPSYPTIAVSMDVGNPTNFPRLLELYQHSLDPLRRDLLGLDFTDDQIGHTIQEMFAAYGYLLDPHSAVAYLALYQYLKMEKHEHPGIFFATAHPSKFLEKITPWISAPIHIPPQLQHAHTKPKNFQTIPPHYAALKKLLLAEAS